MNRGQVIVDIIQKGYWVKATGSRVTSHFSPGSDWDYVVYDPDKTLAHGLKKSPEWEIGGSGNGEEFASYKKVFEGELVNLLLVDKDDVWKKYIVATNIIKAVDPKSKMERIKLFDKVFGKDPDSIAATF